MRRRNQRLDISAAGWHITAMQSDNQRPPAATTGKIFRHAIRVPYAHTDQMRYVYYANYLVYFEMARSEMLREIGLPYGELEAQGIFLPVVEARCEYKSPAHFDDLLEVASTCAIRGVRLNITYTVSRPQPAGQPVLIVTGHTVHVCIAKDGRVLRPPETLRRLIAPDTT